MMRTVVRYHREHASLDLGWESEEEKAFSLMEETTSRGGGIIFRLPIESCDPADRDSTLSQSKRLAKINK